ncbi:hypothetical protein NC651_014860 [Populus alba x Populus x berolinensis]|nr:hypothetical protein NC651_014860 [Populus alba x Populus x berolinensis]
MFVVFGEDFPPLSCQWFFLGKNGAVIYGRNWVDFCCRLLLVMRGKFGYVAGLLEPVCEGEKRGKAGLYAGLLVATESRSGAGFLGGDRCLDFGRRSGDLWTISLKGGRKGRLVFPDGFWHWFDGVEEESGMAGGSGKDDLEKNEGAAATLKACWLVCPCSSVPALFLFVLCLRRSPFWSGSGWRQSGGRPLVAAHERSLSSLFTVEPGLPQCWTCCRHGADEDKLARCKAVTVKGGVSQREIQQPRGCTFSVSKPKTNGR